MLQFIQFTDHRHSLSCGDAITVAVLPNRYDPSSTVAQPSFSQPPELAQQPADSPS